MAQNNPETDQKIERNFEDLTLAELAGQLVRSPRATLRSLAIVTAPLKRSRMIAPPAAVVTSAVPVQRSASRTLTPASTRQLIKLALYLLALVVAFVGNNLYVATPPGRLFGLPNVTFAAGAPFLFGAFVLVIIAEVVGMWGTAAMQQSRLGRLILVLTRRDADAAAPVHAEEIQPEDTLVGTRLILLIPGLVLSVGAFLFNGNNRFNLIGIICWWVSIALIGLAFTRRDWNPLEWVSDFAARVMTFLRTEAATFFTVLLIMGLASFVRLEHIDTTPPEMTSDHVEKLLDAQSISDGEYRVFMEENGGRESLHFYLLALLDQIPGVDLNFMTLKILSALEGIFTIPVFFWLGRELIGKRDRRLGTIVGICLALVGAVALWHIELSRIALRISLTPLVGALLMIYLTRALRYNNRADFIKAGLILGGGLYTYQAVRMMPLLVVAGVIIAILASIRNWRVIRAYVVNFIVLVVVALAVFMPLFRYATQYPESFWGRSAGRLLGEEVVVVTNEVGQTITRLASIEERLDALQDNLGVLGNNIVRALGMFNYRGDLIYLHNPPGHPHLDPLLGAFLIVGLAGWIMWLDRRGDRVDWLVLPGILIMLLPSALAIAAPNENPSTTRASGALPLVLFLVSFAVASLYLTLKQFTPAAGKRLMPIIGSVILVAVAYGYNSWTLFVPYRTVYFESWFPISQGGRIMHGFVEGGSTYGNVFVLSYPYWWDYRAIAIEGGLKPNRWTNGDIALDQVPRRIFDSYKGRNAFPMDVNKDLLFFYHKDDLAAENQFKLWFPWGYVTQIDVKLPDVNDPEFGPGKAYPAKDFKIYRVPALGEQELNAFLELNGFTP